YPHPTRCRLRIDAVRSFPEGLGYRYRHADAATEPTGESRDLVQEPLQCPPTAIRISSDRKRPGIPPSPVRLRAIRQSALCTGRRKHFGWRAQDGFADRPGSLRAQYRPPSPARRTRDRGRSSSERDHKVAAGSRRRRHCPRRLCREIVGAAATLEGQVQANGDRMSAHTEALGITTPTRSEGGLPVKRLAMVG